MNYKLYNYLRLMGVEKEAAALIASDLSVSFDMDIYEQKQAIAPSSHGGFAHVIGLKEEFKKVGNRG